MKYFADITLWIVVVVAVTFGVAGLLIGSRRHPEPLPRESGPSLEHLVLCGFDAAVANKSSVYRCTSVSSGANALYGVPTVVLELESGNGPSRLKITSPSNLPFEERHKYRLAIEEVP